MELVHQRPLGLPAHMVGGDEDGEVDGLEHFQGFLDTLLAHRALVVDAGGVNKHHGADAEYLDGLLDGVGGGAGGGVHNGDVLPGNGVDQGTLAVVPPAENADVRFAVVSFHHGGKSTKNRGRLFLHKIGTIAGQRAESTLSQ